MQEVHTCRRLGAPLTMARTRWMLGFQRRFTRRWEWLIVLPNEGCLPHTSQTAATTRHLSLRAVQEPGEVSIAAMTSSGHPWPRAKAGTMETLDRLGAGDL